MPAPRKDFDKAVAAYNSGASIAKVAADYGISRQSMHKALIRRGVKFRSQIRMGQSNHFFIDGSGYERHQELARSIVSRAIRKGEMTSGPCEMCGFEGAAKDGRNLVHAHHEDYSRPLDVKWLCRPCHFKAHRP